MLALLAHHFRQPPGHQAPLQVHLPQPVQRVSEPLGEHQVVVVAGVNVGHAPAVAQDLDLVSQTRRAQVALRATSKHMICPFGLWQLAGILSQAVVGITFC